jgi:TonB family protein
LAANAKVFLRQVRVIVMCLALSVALFAMGITTSAQDANPAASSPPTPPTAQQAAPQTQASPAPAVAIPTYPDSASGLESLMKEMMRLVKDGDHQTFDAYVKSLALQNASDWYKTVFGDSFGEQVFASTDRARTEFALSSWDMMLELHKEHRTRIEAVRFSKSCDDRATSAEYPILLDRDRPEPLYDVRFTGSGMTSIWPYFAYVNGAFRYLGNFHWAGNPGIGRGAPSGRPPLRVGGNVMQASLIHMVNPKYPTDAKQRGIQGKVVFHVMIGKDGAVKDLVLLEGVCILAQPAQEAVQQWVYKPTKLNGEPVEVDTTITVTFTLGGQY